MANEICPNCKALREMRVASEQRDNVLSEKKEKIIARTYHCSTCNVFVRSENIIINENKE